MPGGYVCSATMKDGAHAPDGLALEDLSVLGPILVLKLNFRPAELDRKLVAEVWSYPNGSRILELSTKCNPGDAAHTALELRGFLADRGVEVSGQQQTKTRTALTYFSKQLG
jgi:hypothetical protein